MPFCSKCGTEVPENVNFCQKCGNALQSGQKNQADKAIPVANTGVEASAGMNKQRIAITIASGFGMLATFLPWASTSFLSFSGTDAQFKDWMSFTGAGWITFVVFALSLILAFLGGNKSEPLKHAVSIRSLIADILFPVLAVFLFSLASLVLGMLITAVWLLIKKQYAELVSFAGLFNIIFGISYMLSLEVTVLEVAQAFSIGIGLYLIVIAGFSLFLTSIHVKYGKSATAETEISPNDKGETL